jgi:hypothetical protein
MRALIQGLCADLSTVVRRSVPHFYSHGPRVGLCAVAHLATCAAKLLLTLALVRYVGEAGFGDYVVFTIWLAYATQAAGAAVYVQVQIEVAGVPRESSRRVLGQHLKFTAASSATVCAAIAVVIICTDVAPRQAIWLVPLIPLGALNASVENYLTGVGRAVTASLLVLSRNVIPLLFIFGLSQRRASTIDVGEVLAIWTLADAVSATLAITTLSVIGYLPDLAAPLSAAWVRRAIGTGMPYLGTTILILTNLSVPRLSLESQLGASSVGEFQLALTLAVFAPNLLESACNSVAMPKLLASRRMTVSTARDRGMDLMLAITVGSGLILVIEFVTLRVLWNAGYLPAAAPAPNQFLPLAAFAVVNAGARGAGQILRVYEDHWWVMWATASSVATTILLAAILGPDLGVAGWGWCLTGSAGCQLLASVYIVAHYSNPSKRD